LTAYKLFRRRADGTLGPLFCGRRQRIPIGRWLRAGVHPAKGLALRPGWHCVETPHAPHLSLRGRVWARVEIRGAKRLVRPASHGGAWLLARQMRVLEVLCP
jgi:hypothetical protein